MKIVCETSFWQVEGLKRIKNWIFELLKAIFGMTADKGFKFWAAFFVVKTHLTGRVDSDRVKFDRGAIERKFNVATVGPWNREDIPDTRTFTWHHIIN